MELASDGLVRPNDAGQRGALPRPGLPDHDYQPRVRARPAHHLLLLAGEHRAMHGELGAKAPNLTLDELGRNRGVRGTAGEPRGGGLRAERKARASRGAKVASNSVSRATIRASSSSSVSSPVRPRSRSAATDRASNPCSRAASHHARSRSPAVASSALSARVAIAIARFPGSVG